MRYTPWIVSEHVPDAFSLQRLLAHPRFQGKTGEALAVALWEFMTDPELGIFHYCPAYDRFTGKDSADPLAILNVYGFAICHIHADVLTRLFAAAGFEVRIASIQGHEGSEAYYDGGWHYFDADIQMFYRRRSDGAVASLEELHADLSLITEPARPSFPFHLPDRLPENMRKLYATPPAYNPPSDEPFLSMDYRLRPGESLTRLFHHKGRWHMFPSYAAMFRAFSREPGAEGPTERFWPRRQWGNGFFEYAPDLTDASDDARQGAEEIAGLQPGPRGLRCAEASGRVVFEFESPYIFCGFPDIRQTRPAVDGAQLSLAFELPQGASVIVEAAADGPDKWIELWRSAAAGEQKAELDWTAVTDGMNRAAVRVTLNGAGACLTRFHSRLWFMCSPHALPALRRAGPNRLWLHSGDEYGWNTRPMRTEIYTDNPAFPAALHSSANLRLDPATYSRLLPEDSNRPWEVVFRLRGPRGERVAWVAANAAIESRRPGEPLLPEPAVIEISRAGQGPWTRIAGMDIRQHEQGWHFHLAGKGFLPGGGPDLFVRFRARKGAKYFRLAGHYEVLGGAPQGPLEIEHRWYEVDPRVGRRLRTHVERTVQPEHAYVVECAETPHNEEFVLHCPHAVK